MPRMYHFKLGFSNRISFLGASKKQLHDLSGLGSLHHGPQVLSSTIQCYSTNLGLYYICTTEALCSLYCLDSRLATGLPLLHEAQNSSSNLSQSCVMQRCNLSFLRWFLWNHQLICYSGNLAESMDYMISKIFIITIITSCNYRKKYLLYPHVE